MIYILQILYFPQKQFYINKSYYYSYLVKSIMRFKKMLIIKYGKCICKLYLNIFSVFDFKFCEDMFSTYIYLQSSDIKKKKIRQFDSKNMKRRLANLSLAKNNIILFYVIMCRWCKCREFCTKKMWCAKWWIMAKK